MKKSLVLVSVAGLVLLGPAHAAGDAAAGKAKSAACAGCHGPDGNAPAPMFPKLAGQSAAYIAKQLGEFKSGTRQDATMQGMAAGLSEADMADLGAHYASQTVRPGAAAADQVAAGQKVYRAGNQASGVSACAACHGPSGAGNPQAGFPALGGQHASYIVAQLKNFRDGKRNNDAAAMMRTVAGKMSDAEIDAVAQFIQGLH